MLQDIPRFAEFRSATIIFNNSFYDAECPEEVDSFMELPLYKEILHDYVNKQNAKENRLDERCRQST